MFMKMNHTNFTPHIPVLLDELITYSEPEEGYENKLVVDCTFGAGGYSQAFLAKGARVVAIDRDPNVKPQAEFFAKKFGDRFSFINTSFSQLGELSIESPDLIVLDLGVSSMQIDQAERGFSFQKEGPLDMRMSAEGLSAAEIVNSFALADLVKIFRSFGEEKRAVSIARMIVKKRAEKPFTTTLELSNAIEALLPRRYFEKIHPATRVFQALRMYVNNELGELVQALIAAEKLLKAGGKLSVVSFHSLEDRIVKKFLHRCAVPLAVSRYLPAGDVFSASFELVTKSLITASVPELAYNPRSRSAKLRVAKRTHAAPLKHKEQLTNASSLLTKNS